MLLAQAPPATSDVVAFSLMTLVFLGLAGYVLLKIASNEAKLILLGLMVAILATGYGSLVRTSAALAPTLMKIGVILILCGAACSILSYLKQPPPPQGSGGGPEGKVW